jgi:hypothetical protein
MKKSLMIGLMVAALVCAFALPSVIAANAPAPEMVLKAPEGGKMTKAAVPFPHKKHEGLADCLVCHHKAADKNAIKGCSVEGCHTDTSKAAKREPTGFYQAFHNKKVKNSCMGCHKAEKKGPKGCNCHPKKK